jgi:phenylacetate-CoA ligase
MPRLQLKGINLMPARESFDPIETASRDEIAALQLERLKWTLSHAYNNVVHYKKAFDKAGVHPRDLKKLDDLPKFPFTAKEDLRARYPFGMFAIPRDHVLRVHASSGTTGKPTVVGYSQRDLDTWAGLMAPPCVRPAASRACWCRTRTAMGCSPAALVFTTGPSGSA